MAKTSSKAAIVLDTVRDKNVMQLKKLNLSIFPVNYPESFYKDAITSGDLCRLAFYGDIYVGAVASRLETIENGSKKLYIMTLGVLAPYRRLGIGSVLLKHCLDYCARDTSIKEIYLHVQTSNEEALSFYGRHGFVVTGTIENYYKRITPPDCHVLAKQL